MTSSLTQFCDLVSNVAISSAKETQQSFFRSLPSGTEGVNPDDILKFFAFMNYTFAQGAWSSLKNAKLRRDLVVALKEDLITKLARLLARSDSVQDTAAKAVFLSEELNDYLRQFIARMQSMGDADSRTATLFAFESIQNECKLDDSVMNEIVPRLMANESFGLEVESVALQVNNVFAQRKKGFLSKLFGS